MDDAARVGCRERIGYLQCTSKRIINGEGAALKASGQRLPLNELHDEITRADVVERVDTGMVKSGNGASFAFKTIGETLQTHLDSDGPVQPRIDRAIDLAHAAGAENGLDFIRTDQGAR